MTWLLDGNVLVALFIDTHVHHRAARAWFASGTDPVATCAVTQGTLLRLHMALGADRSAEAAWSTLKALEAHPRHVFWPDSLPYSEVPHRHLQGPKQVTDAWLAELARRRQACLLTADSALTGLHPDVASLLPT